MGIRKFRHFCILACVAAFSAASAAGLTIVATQDLAFGKFAAAAGGSVTVSPAGARSKSGGVVLVSSGPGNAALFSVTGDPGATYAVSLPSASALTRVGGATMTVNTFTSSPATTGVLGAGGSQTLAVGATLSVGSSQPVGAYTGTFDVTVNYN